MEAAHELKNYLDSEGRLKSYPSKRKYKIMSLIYLAGKFEKGVVYTEKEINDVLESFHTFNDRCLLRRELYNNKFFGRLNNCSKYWLEERQPVFEDFKLN